MRKLVSTDVYQIENDECYIDNFFDKFSHRVTYLKLIASEYLTLDYKQYLIL